MPFLKRSGCGEDGRSREYRKRVSVVVFFRWRRDEIFGFRAAQHVKTGGPHAITETSCVAGFPCLG